MESTELVSAGELHGPLQERRFSVRTAVDGVARWFPENRRREWVTTALRFDLPSERVWEALRFYEESPVRPSAVLRWLLPTPVRSEGQKDQVGALIRCTYDGGYLVKRIGIAEPPHFLRFDVVEQHLGIEHCISLDGGWYRIQERGDGCEVSVTTSYRGHLRPRFLWCPLERALAHAVHRHILGGMRELQDGR